MRSTDPALLAIEVQPRYRDLLSGHWPVVAGPQPDELLSSWLHRCIDWVTKTKDT